jgi:hypothetical protein
MYEERVRGPSADDHDFCTGLVHEEECHGGPRPDGSFADLVGMESERSESPVEVAGVAEKFADERVGEVQHFSIEEDQT